MPASRPASKNKKPPKHQDTNHFISQIADLTPDLLTVLDISKSEIIYVNKRTELLLGMEATHIYKTGPQIFESLVHPNDYGSCISVFNSFRKLRGPEEMKVEARLKLADGAWNWFRLRLKVFNRNARGAVLQTIIIAQDIQAQKIADEKLKEEHRRFKNAQTIGHIGSFEMDLPGEQMICSEEFFRILGLPPDTGTIPFHRFLSFVHPEDQESFLSAVKSCQTTGEPFNEVNKVVHPDGDIRHVQGRAEILQDRQGNPARMYGTIQDITVQTQTYKKIRKSEDLMRRAEIVGMFGSYEADLRSGHFWLSDGFYRLFGYEPQGFEPTLEFIDSVSHPDDTEKVGQVLEQAARDKKPYVYYRRIYRLDGQLRYLKSNGKVICDSRGKAVKFLGIVEDITEQKLAEDKLITEHRRMKEAQAIGRTGSFEWVKDQDRHYWSDEMYRIHGLEPQSESITLERILNFIHADDLAVVKSSIFQFMEQPGSGDFIHRLWRTDGELLYIHGRYESFADDTGKVTHMHGTLQDITEQKNAELELKKANAELERSNTTISRMLEGSLAAIILLDPLRNKDGHVTDFIFKGANKATEILKQKAAADLLGKRLMEVFPDVRDNLFEALLSVLETGNSIRMERRHKYGPPGSWIDLSATKNGDGIILTFIDITDRKKARKLLEESALFIRKVADTTPDILFVFDQEKMQLQYTNRNLHPLLGKNLKPNEVPDLKELLSHIHPDERKCTIRYMKRIEKANDEKVKELVFRIQNKEGEWRWFHCRGRVFKRSPVGKILQHLFIMRDITEEKKITKALLEAEELSVKGTIARTIAHEVRVPAANISLSMEMIQKELGDKLTRNEEAMTFFNIVNKSCRRITEFINDLISISVTEPDSFTKTDLGVLAEEVLSEANDRIYLKGAQAERHFSNGYFIKADQERLKIALLNIVVNAVEAMEDKKGHLKVSIQQQDAKVQITIQDNGSGMTEDQLSKMFDMYYTSKHEGMGVGLANVKAILKDHKAKISVKSKPGKGTSFNIIFPKAR